MGSRVTKPDTGVGTSIGGPEQQTQEDVIEDSYQEDNHVDSNQQAYYDDQHDQFLEFKDRQQNKGDNPVDEIVVSSSGTEVDNLTSAITHDILGLNDKANLNKSNYTSKLSKFMNPQDTDYHMKQFESSFEDWMGQPISVFYSMSEENQRDTLESLRNYLDNTDDSNFGVVNNMYMFGS